MANIDGWFREALRLNREGNAREALKQCRKILKKVPKHPGALALAGALAMDQGDAKGAVPYLQKAVKLHAGDGSVHLALARALRITGDHLAARKALEQAAGRGQGGGRLAYEQGMLARAEDRLGEASALLAQAVRLAPSDAEYAFELGVVRGMLLDFPGCVQAFERAAEIRPDDPRAIDQALFFSLYDESLPLSEVRARHDRWGDTVARRVQGAQPAKYSVSPDPERPLQVGLISGDFRGHAVTHFLQPLFTDPLSEQFRITCYSNVAEPDAVTEMQRSLAPRWRDITLLKDDRAASQIYRDGIDILIDLSGHTIGNRLGVLALRPAPVQATWLGHPSTTGLPSVDYRLSDAVLDPPGSEALYRERLAYIDGGFCCYAPPPPDVAPEVGPLPARANGRVTFGSVMNPRKMSDRAIRVWSEVLNRVPDARLHLLRATFRQGELRERFLAAFEGHGVGRERIEIGGHDRMTWKDILSFYNTVDLSMDTFRYNGATTTCEALWMGVPVVALSGQANIDRVGQSLYAMLDMPEMVAADEAAFVELAVNLANDPERLAELRAGMRDRMRAGRLLDAPAFMNALAGTLRGMWREWCASRSPSG